MYFFELGAHFGRVRESHQQLELHLQTRKRCAQLMGRVGKKPVLHGIRLAQSLEQVIEREHCRAYLLGRQAGIERAEVCR